MTLSGFTNAISLVTPLVVGLQAGGREGGVAGVLFGVVIGTMAGIGCLMGTRKVVKWIERQPKLQPANTTSLWTAVTWMIFLGLFVWIAGVGIAETFLVKWIVHLIPG